MIRFLGHRTSAVPRYACRHSSVVSCVSIVNSCRCLISEDMISLSRGGVLGPIDSMTFCVNSLPKGADSTLEPMMVLEQWLVAESRYQGKKSLCMVRDSRWLNCHGRLIRQSLLQHNTYQGQQYGPPSASPPGT